MLYVFLATMIDSLSTFTKEVLFGVDIKMLKRGREIPTREEIIATGQNIGSGKEATVYAVDGRA